jgi:DNA-binding MarR family transcriptional regulator
MSRRALGRLLERELAGRVDLTTMGVIDAIDAGPGSDGAAPTVGDVAQRLGLDPSRASRVVAAAVQGGWVRRVAQQRDGRRVGLELTDAGGEVVAAAQTLRQAVFRRAVRRWSAEERALFADLLNQFLDGIEEATTES